MRRAVFEALGRFPEQPFLEDLHLVLEARRRGPGAVVTMGASVRSSSRRWEMRNGTEHLKSRPANPTEGLPLPQSQPLINLTLPLSSPGGRCTASLATACATSACSSATCAGCPSHASLNGTMAHTGKRTTNGNER